MEYKALINELLERGRISQKNHADLTTAIENDLANYGETKYVQGVTDGIAHSEQYMTKNKKKTHPPKPSKKDYKVDLLIKELIDNYKGFKFSNQNPMGDDYRTFEEKYLNIIKHINKNIKGDHVVAHQGHYYFTAFIQRNEKFVYISISDVRHEPDQWIDKILIRTATHPKDYISGVNEFTSLIDLEYNLDRLLS